MCMSFTDLSLGRQEQVYVNTLDYARRYKTSDLWTLRGAHMARVIADAYTDMDTADLYAHRIEVAGNRDGDWSPVVLLVDDELARRRCLSQDAAEAIAA